MPWWCIWPKRHGCMCHGRPLGRWNLLWKNKPNYVEDHVLSHKANWSPKKRQSSATSSVTASQIHGRGLAEAVFIRPKYQVLFALSIFSIHINLLKTVILACYIFMQDDCSMQERWSCYKPNLHQHDVVDSPVRMAYRACDWLVHPRWLATQQPAHPSDLDVIDFRSAWWSSTPWWIITGLTYQVKSFQYIFILYIAFFKRAITLACKLFNAGQVVYCKRDYYITELLNDSYRFISRSNMENLKTTPRVVLRLGGYNDMTRELRVIGGNDNPVPEDTAILMKI